MNVDGNFEFYRFIWDGLDDGWGLTISSPMHGVKLHFAQGGPTAIDLKQIRAHWLRFKNKSPSYIKSLIGQNGFVIGKWPKATADEVCAKIVAAGCNAEVVEVMNYRIANTKTAEVAQIRSDEVYDEVIAALIRNEAVITPDPGSCGAGGCYLSDE